MAILMAAAILCFFCVPVHAQTENISAHAAVLYDPISETVLFSRSADEVLPIASTTKIMTALLAFESGRAEEPVKITPEMIRVEGSSMGLKAGDILMLGELAEGMMMTSGNDAANAIAVFLAGDAERFAVKMNARAAEIGMKNTNFVTPSGLDAEGHGSTAYDMALLGAEAMRCEAFRAAVSETAQTVDYLSPEQSFRYQNHNRLLQLYENCIGIKTGFTKKAGRCLVSAAEKNGAMLICVTLNAPDDWNDHIALYEDGFTRFSEREITAQKAQWEIPVVGGEKDRVRCAAVSDVSVNLLENTEIRTETYLPRFTYAPVQKGDILGRVEYYAGSTKLAEVQMTALEAVTQKADTRSDFDQWKARVFR